MSNVRLSNGSPPLERVEARQREHGRASVCRNLFGASDPEEVNRVYLEEMQESERRSVEKYNFDFRRDVPLAPGSYVWEEADAKHEPAFYSRPPHARKRLDVNGNNGNNGECQNQRRKRVSTEDAGSPRQSKRVNDGEEERSSRETTEQTPRKSEPST